MTIHSRDLSPLAFAIIISFGGCFYAQAETVQFDDSILKSLGISESVANYFSDSAHFTPGKHIVEVMVNGKSQGKMEAVFGNKGELCTDSELLQQAGLVVPFDAPARNKGQCYNYQQSVPSSVVTPVPGSERVELVVPQDQVSSNNMSGISKVYDTGGNAGLLNYQAFTTKNKYSDSSSTYSQAMLEEGLNFSDWLVRSKQMLVDNEGDKSVDSTYAYLQHTIVSMKKIVQIGQFNISNTPFAGSEITGAQLIPEDNLFGNNGSGVTVSGIAQTAQARVEVRQSGHLIYSTLVPAGPFNLQDVPVTAANTDLDITVKETDGSRTHFVLPANVIHSGNLERSEGMSMSAGKYRATDGEVNAPMLATIADKWNVNPWLNLGAGSMLAQDYDALGITVDTVLFQDILVSANLKESNDTRHDKNGHSTGLSINYSTPANIGISGSMTRYSNGYRELEDSLQDDFSQYSSEYSANLHWAYPSLGSFNLGFSQSMGGDGGDTSRYLNASWGRKFGRVNVNVSWMGLLSSEEGHSDNSNGHNDYQTNNGDQLYVNISFPLGKQNISAYSHKQHDTTNTGLQTTGNINDDLSYTVSASHDSSERENDFSGSLNSNLHYTKFGISAASNGTDDKNVGVMVSGAVVGHKNGVTFSPYQVKDTFAIADIGSHISGVGISTPSGNVWTDHWGRAVIPSLRPYHAARIEMNTASLPDNVDVDNGYGNVSAGHGAVSQVNFQISHVHRAMLTVSMPDGELLKKDTSVVDKHGSYAGTVVEDGLLFINDVDNTDGLFAQNEEGKNICQIFYNLDKQKANTLYYQKAKGSCH